MKHLIVHLIAAARPNFMKVAPVYAALRKQAWCTPLVVHTGQHYDADMSDAFLRDLGLPEPDLHLGVGSGTHAVQTAGVMIAYERICMDRRPDWVIVVGDVNSTFACTLAAKKLGIPVAHLEAGLRSRDMTMPEEINRLLTDTIADLLWTPSPDADENLRAEGVVPARIARVGNIMIDAYEMMRAQITAEHTAHRLGLAPRRYAVVTLHRPGNVDREDSLRTLVDLLRDVAGRLPIVFPVHPRTRARLEAFSMWDGVTSTPGLRVTSPMGYVSFMSLVQDARFVLTDSGSIQEETTYLDLPCLTLRPTTERPITITQGTNRLVTPDTVGASVQEILADRWPRGRCPEYWDGRAADRVVASLRQASAERECRANAKTANPEPPMGADERRWERR